MKQETKETSIFVRFLVYVTGFLIMTLGIAMSVKSDLGVSPVSSIPYTMTCVWGIEMGKATILFHVGLVLLQIILLRRLIGFISDGYILRFSPPSIPSTSILRPL